MEDEDPVFKAPSQPERFQSLAQGPTRVRTPLVPAEFLSSDSESSDSNVERVTIRVPESLPVSEREEIEIRVSNVEEQVSRAKGPTFGPKPDIIHISSSDDSDVEDKMLDGMNKATEEISPSRRRRRRLPSSFTGKEKDLLVVEKAPSLKGKEKSLKGKEKDVPIEEEKREKKGTLLDYVDDLKVIFGKPYESDEEEDWFDMIQRKGLIKFDKPRWWP